jgi:hypothetical protein
MARESPVFVVGLPRSGTSVLRTTLSGLPAFAFRGSRLPETRVFREPERIAQVLEPRGRRLFTFLVQDRDAAERMLASLRARPPRTALRRPGARALGALPQSPVARRLAWRLAGRHHDVRIFFHYGCEARGARRILEKTPQHVFFLPELFATFPHARVLLCIRHPVDAYASLRRRLERDRAAGRPAKRLRWMEVGVTEYAEAYARTAAIIARALRRRPRQCLRVRYEDLTRDPSAALREICDRAGEPFDPERLLSGRQVLRDPAGSFEKGSRIAGNQSSWRGVLDPDRARRLEDALDAPLRRLGYARYT